MSDMDQSESNLLLAQLKSDRLSELDTLKTNLFAYINKFYPDDIKKNSFEK